MNFSAVFATTITMTTLLASTNVLAATSFFECSGFADTPEYRVGINLKSKQADFFDNDTNSLMALKETKILETSPTQTLLIFEGADAGSQNGRLRLEFNLTRKAAVIFEINSRGKTKSLGSRPCAPAQPW